MRSSVVLLLVAAAALLPACGTSRGASAVSIATVTPTPVSTGSATPTPTPGTDAPLRFVAIGDTGTGEAGQIAVANAIANKCAAEACDFGVLLGDNFYPSGVSSATDPNFDVMFQQIYGTMGFPFYVVLGNHDYGVNGAGTQFDIGAYEVEYGLQHDNWKLPGEFYAFENSHATFLGLGTDLIFWDHNGAIAEQGQYFSAALTASTKPWRISMGHHPYFSNGTHGNAGSYDGIPWLPIANGENVKTFFDSYLCGKVDLFLSGHDHSRQVIAGTDVCPGTFVVSGAGAKTTALPGAGPSLFQRDTIGFAWFEVRNDSIKIEMIDSAGNVEFTTTITH